MVVLSKVFISLVLFLTPSVLAYLLDISSQMSGHVVPVHRRSAHTIGFGMLLCCLCLSFMRVHGDGDSRFQRQEGSVRLLRYTAGPEWIEAMSSLAFPVVPSWQAVDFGDGHSHIYLCPPGSPHALSRVSVFCLLMSSPRGQTAWFGKEAVFPPSGWRHLPKKSHPDAFFPLSVGLPLSTLAPAPSLPIPLLLLTLLMKNRFLCKGASDCTRVLTCIEKNDYLSSSGASSHKEGSRTLIHTFLTTSS